MFIVLKYFFTRLVVGQKQILEITLNQWMNFDGIKMEQIDDIVVMGIKVR